MVNRATLCGPVALFLRGYQQSRPGTNGDKSIESAPPVEQTRQNRYKNNLYCCGISSKGYSWQQNIHNIHTHTHARTHAHAQRPTRHTTQTPPTAPTFKGSQVGVYQGRPNSTALTLSIPIRRDKEGLATRQQTKERNHNERHPTQQETSNTTTDQQKSRPARPLTSTGKYQFCLLSALPETPRRPCAELLTSHSA